MRASWMAHALGLAGLVLLAGCSGSARVQVTSLATNAIDPPAAEIVNFNPDRCWWWLDEHGRLCIAMQQDRPSLLGPIAHATFRMSLVLGEPSAGVGKNYGVDRYAMRASYHQGPSSHRFRSTQGVVAVRDRANQVYEGTFRMWALHQSSGVLAGWGRAGPYLFLGRFRAVHNPEAGQTIRAETEYGMWARPHPTTRPTTNPSTSSPGAAGRLGRPKPADSR